MTNIYLAVSIAALFAVSLAVGQSALAGGDETPGYLKIEKSKFTYINEDDESWLKAEVKTESRIPKDGSVAMGIALVTQIDGAGAQDVWVGVGHMCAADSFEQGNVGMKKCPVTVGVLELLGLGPEGTNADNDGKRYHAHRLDVTFTVSSACGDYTLVDPSFVANAEVDVAGTIATDPGLTLLSPDNQVRADGKWMRMGDIPVNDLGDPSKVPIPIAFRIAALADDTNTITNLCLDLEV